MKNIKKLLALILVLVMALSITACHPKDETAISLGDDEITSAIYLIALINAEDNARSRAYSIASQSNITLYTDEDYYNQTIDGKDFKTYVKDTALDLCKQYLALDKLLAEGKYKLPEDIDKTVEQLAQNNWYAQGLSVLYEANGISYESYKKTVRYSQMAEAYFLSIYGEGGSKEVSKEELKKALAQNYVLAYTLDGTSNSDTELTALKKEFAGYKADIEAGKKTFREIYIKYNKITDEQIKNAEKVEEGVSKPKDIFAFVIGGSKTSNPDSNFAAIQTMKKDEIKIIDSDSGCTLVVRLDINEDPYYFESLEKEVLNILKNEEFSKELETYTNSLNVDVSDFATNRFKVEDIVTYYDLQTAQ